MFFSSDRRGEVLRANEVLRSEVVLLLRSRVENIRIKLRIIKTMLVLQHRGEYVLEMFMWWCFAGERVSGFSRMRKETSLDDQSSREEQSRKSKEERCFDLFSRCSKILG